MANNYTQGTVTPSLSKDLFTEEDLELLKEDGYNYEDDYQDSSKYYFYIEEYYSGEFDEEIFQKILNSEKNKEYDIKYIYVQAAYYCDKLRRDEHGGWCQIFTKDEMYYMNTYKFIQETIEAITNGNFKV
jgi:hypothetical protein